MFHIEYNEERGYFTWSELRCLCRALGFQPDLITNNLPSEVDQQESGMLIKDILRIINLKYLDLAVDKTFNAHTADWNLCVFKKAFVLLDHRILTYQELHDIRVAFCAYEHQDLKGMLIDENIIMRCLKMCGRIIAPLKMHHRIKHMSQLFDEEDRIQLYEFLDLILWTEMFDAHKPHQLIVTNAKEKNSSIFQVEDFQHILQHHDERLAQYLNELYLHEEWSFGKEEFSKQKLPNELPVYRDFRLKNMSKSKKHYKYLKNQVVKSQDNVHTTSTGHVRPRPLTAPRLEKYEQSEKSSIYTAHSQHKLTVGDMVRDYIHTPAIRLIRSASPRMKLGSNIGPPTGLSAAVDYESVAPAVTRDDKLQREHDLQDLKFHISTLENRYDQKLQKAMNEHLPNYVPRPKVVEPLVLKPKSVNPALLSENINKLAYSPYRPVPKPSHAGKCDARYRGWHKIMTTKGSHYILTTNSFGDSPAAKQHAKLNEEYAKTVKNVKGDCVFRKTTSKNVKPEILRPPAPFTTTTVQSSQSERPQSKANEPLIQTPNKMQRSSARVVLAGMLDTISEVSGSRKPSANSRKLSPDSRKPSARPSTTSSSNKSYTFSDFKLYTEEYDKPEEKVELSAKNLTDDSQVGPTTPRIVLHKPTLGNLQVSSVATDRRYSQVTGNDIAKDIVGQVDNHMASQQHLQKMKSVHTTKVKNLIKRRKLSGYVKKRLIDSARERNFSLTAC